MKTPVSKSHCLNERDASVFAVARVLFGGERAEHVVPALLGSLRDLDNDGRVRVAKRVYGVCVLRLRLAFLLEHSGGIAPLRELDAAAYLDAYARFEESAQPNDAPAPPWPASPRERISVERSAPLAFVDALVASLGLVGADAFLAASNVPGPRTLRVNPLKASRAELRERLAREDVVVVVDGKLSPHAVHVEGKANLFGSQAWRDGWFEVQDEASQLVALACQARPGDVVVDLCAGRGGKTLALAAMMQDRGSLYVHDVDSAALSDLKPRVKRAGATCVCPWSDLGDAASGAGGDSCADVVLVDAPCSSTGTLRRSPDLRWQPLVTHGDTQRALVHEAARIAKPGGRVVYATCSVLDEENARVVNDVIAVDGAPLVLASTRTYLPHIEGTDGFFVAVLTRC